MMNKYVRFVRFLICLALATILVACVDAATEKHRASNSSNTIDAVIASRHTTATPATPTEIYVLPKGGRLSRSPVFKADGVEGLHITWDNESQLTIHAKKARIFQSEPSIEIRVPDGSRSILVKIGLDIQVSN